jgi:hypothetical protein
LLFLWTLLSGGTLNERSAWADQQQQADIYVDCDAGRQSITKALDQVEADPITISVNGACHENVTIQSPNVTLVTTSGATITAADDTRPVVFVRADGATIDGFTIVGGLSGIVASGVQRLNVRNCTIQDASSAAINVVQSSDATIDHCTLTNNRFGVTAALHSSFTITNSVVSNNTFAGVQAVFGSAAFIGGNVRAVMGGNQIFGNGASGIHIAAGSFAAIAQNTIANNGTNNIPHYGHAGVTAYEAGVNVAGGNTISGNGSFGIELRASIALIGAGDEFPNIDHVNTIVGNGVGPNAPPNGGAGISAILGSKIELENANISNNTGYGIFAQLQSSVHSINTTVNSNSKDGVQLTSGSGLLLDDPQNTATSNGGFDLNCLDAESSVAGNITGFANVSQYCTGF